MRCDKYFNPLMHEFLFKLSSGSMVLVIITVESIMILQNI